MDAVKENNRAPRIAVWYGQVIIAAGFLLFATGIVSALAHFLKEGGSVLMGLKILFKLAGTSAAVCGFGLGVARGKRWYLFGLLIFIFFGSFVIGLFSMVGRETQVGYYIWAAGGLLSFSVFLILVVYWETLQDG